MDKLDRMKKLGFGLMRLPHIGPNDQADIDYEKTQALIDRFMEAGFGYFDTALAYQNGEGERCFGKLVADRYPRDSFFLTTKLPSWHFSGEEDLEKSFEEELERLHLDYIDCYYIHALAEHNMDLPEKKNYFDFFARKKAEGKVKNIGFSFHGTPLLLEKLLTEHPEIDMVQLQLNYMDWEAPNVQSRACHEICVKHGVKITVMEPLKGGTLVNIPEKAKELMYACRPDLSIASWGIRYAASLPNVAVVLSGMNAMDQMDDNISYMKDFEPLNAEEMKVLEEVREIIRSDIYIPCTACRYCEPGCPMNISIPDYFSLYNDYKRSGEVYLPIHWNIYHSLIAAHGMAKDCIGCGQCEERCPQHLPIISYLKEFSDCLDGRTHHD